MTFTDLPLFFRDKGWSSYGELAHFAFWAKFGAAFTAWRELDGTKAGLLANVGLREGSPDYRPIPTRPCSMGASVAPTCPEESSPSVTPEG